jgi:hypothetical protein
MQHVAITRREEEDGFDPGELCDHSLVRRWWHPCCRMCALFESAVADQMGERKRAGRGRAACAVPAINPRRRASRTCTYRSARTVIATGSFRRQPSARPSHPGVCLFAHCSPGALITVISAMLSAMLWISGVLMSVFRLLRSRAAAQTESQT